MKKISHLLIVSWILVVMVGTYVVAEAGLTPIASTPPLQMITPNLLTETQSTQIPVVDLDSCDSGLTLDSNSPLHAAQAMDICKISLSNDDWGLYAADYVMADGNSISVSPSIYDIGHGILTAFGDNVTPQRGERFLALSTGTARQPTDPGYVAPDQGLDKGYDSDFPAGFPQGVFGCLSMCELTGTPHDDAALQLTLVIPPNADGFSFDYKFYTTDYKYPQYICTQFNDWFIAILDYLPSGPNDVNIAFGPNANPVTVNNSSLMEVCSPRDCYVCPLGIADLVGTGFEDSGASGWLTASAEIPLGTQMINLRLAIYDSGDGFMDSTVLIDNFRWHWFFPTYLPMVIK